MARSRNIKPGFFTNADLAACSPLARIIFAGLWTIADKAGRLRDRPKQLKGELLPYDDCDVDALLNELATGDEPFIYRYSVESVAYIQVVNWDKHQSPHHTERDSVISPCINGEQTVVAPNATNQESGISEEGIRNRKSGIHPLGAPKEPTSAQQVAEHYRGYHPRSKAGDKEIAKIKDRLGDGFSVADLKLAIDGCHVSPWHCGQNDDGRKYQNLELIVRDASKVTQFLELASTEGDPKLSAQSRKNLTAIQSWLEKNNGVNDAR